MPARDTAPPSITCVMPAYNEAANLPHVVPHVLEALLALSPQVELLIVDDGSRDGTADVVRELCRSHPQCVLLELSRNFGKEAAISAGLEQARGDVTVIMDADGQHPTDLLPDMLRHWQAGADMVYAVRTSRDDQRGLHIGLIGWFYRLVNWRSRVQIPPNAGDFRWMDRTVVAALNALPERNRFMKGLYAWVGYRTVALPYQPLDRHSGVTRFNWHSSLQLGLAGMMSFSTLPLRLMTVSGLLLAFFSLLYGLWIVLDVLIGGKDVPGFATIATAVMFFSGVQLLSIGLLAEYVGRIYDEVKRRPLFIVRERVGQGLDPDHDPAAAPQPPQSARPR
ncbi:glycosyltransferase family 2 protein [Amphibiibacter pelophylacis]|uniref:Glycosyltransferase family 2 protein n=1 Tax=Amphibiibacter pelophylacis TaxID=1799477 RepID=A0ACC6P4F1_9BURK